MVPPDRKPIGYCQVCFEQSAEPVLAYFRRSFVHPQSGKRMQGVPMCRSHSNRVTRYGNPYHERRVLTDEERAEIVRRYQTEHVSTRELAADYDITYSHVARLVREANAKKKRG